MWLLQPHPCGLVRLPLSPGHTAAVLPPPSLFWSPQWDGELPEKLRSRVNKLACRDALEKRPKNRWEV